jgi:hypothetical protein
MLHDNGIDSTAWLLGSKWLLCSGSLFFHLQKPKHIARSRNIKGRLLYLWESRGSKFAYCAFGLVLLIQIYFFYFDNGVPSV